MKIVVIVSGAVGAAIRQLLKQQSHEVVAVGRSSGDRQADITDPTSPRVLFASPGSFDAVASAAGHVYPGPFDQTTDDQWERSIRTKGMGQINVVRAALPYIADRGSFTLISGVLSQAFIHGDTIGITVNHLVEGFVRSAATELPRGVRINCVSLTMLEESPAFQIYMPGLNPPFRRRMSQWPICA